MECTTQTLRIDAITVSARIRKDTGGVGELAADIEERGLIHAVTVMDCGDGRYQLIAGLRRLEACKSLGHTTIRATILSPMDADEQLGMEYAENVQRRDFTLAERLEYADKIKAVEQAKAKERMAAYAREGHGDGSQGVGDRPHPETGKSRDFIAQKAGFSSSRQHRRVLKIAAERPEMLEKIDAGEATIWAVHNEIVHEAKAADPLPPSKAPSEASPAVEQSRPDQITRAGHDRLMKNPLYAELWAKWKKAVAEANTAVTELEFRSKGYENRIRNYQDNVAALSRRCEALEQEIAALRARQPKYAGGNA